MTYTLLIGEYAYSSWSMRGWLLVDAFGIPFRPNYVPMYSDEFTALQEDHFPARTVPMLTFEENGDTLTIWDSLAIAETLAERHPQAGLWPEDPHIRMMARALAAQMHSGFAALRDRPSMNLRTRYEAFRPTEAEQTDADRVEALWAWALDTFGGPYLCGEKFTVADVMFAPVATRFVTYGFAMTDTTRQYIETIYAHPSFRRWHACADAQLRVIERYHLNLPEGDNSGWPRHPRLPGKHYEGDVADAINEVCPYSGKPIAPDSLALIDGKVVGFCNPFCCRRGMADAESWPTVLAAMGR